MGARARRQNRRCRACRMPPINTSKRYTIPFEEYMIANALVSLRSRGAACEGLFPWKPYSPPVRNELCSLKACRAADGKRQGRVCGARRNAGGAILNVRQTPAYRHVLFPMFLRDKNNNCSDTWKHRLPIKGLRFVTGVALLRCAHASDSEWKCQPCAFGSTK